MGTRQLIIGTFFITIIIGLCLIFLLTTPTNAQSTPPSEGDWEIDSRVTIEQQKFILNGDLIIKEGGSLYLRNVDLKIDSKSDNGLYVIRIENGGKLELYNSVLNSYSGNQYVIIVEPKGVFNIYNSNVTSYITIDPNEPEGEPFPIYIFMTIFIVVIVVAIITMLAMSMKPKGLEETEVPNEHFYNPRELHREVGIVVKTVYPNHAKGVVKVKREEWCAMSNMKNQIIHKGEKVIVIDTRGFKLMVERFNE